MRWVYKLAISWHYSFVVGIKVMVTVKSKIITVYELNCTRFSIPTEYKQFKTFLMFF